MAKYNIEAEHISFSFCVRHLGTLREMCGQAQNALEPQELMIKVQQIYSFG